MVLKEWVITRKLTLFHFHGLTLTRADFLEKRADYVRCYRHRKEVRVLD